jgi:tetratricopeptide (TPR) repeat protein
MDTVRPGPCGDVTHTNDAGGLVAQAHKPVTDVQTVKRMREQERRREMHPLQRLLHGTLIGLLWGAIGLVQAHEPRMEQLGEVHFPVACSADVQQPFDRAVALLHSFSFADAAKAFAAVAQQDSSCAMAHWGVAMARRGGLYGGRPGPNALAEGWTAVENAQTVGGKTPREHDYIAAIAVFYTDADQIEHRTRALAYTRAMEQLHRTYPDDREAEIFYAYALSALAEPTDQTYAAQLKAGEILEKIFAAQPNHPGVMHYLIHSYDHTPIAHRGLPAARRYAMIAPSAPHALHIPSHIFVRLGLWQESIDTNRVAAAVEDQFYQLHAMDFLAHSYLQVAQDVAAKHLLDELTAIEHISVAHLLTAYALAALPSRYAVERRRWGDAAALTLPRRDFPWGRFPHAEAVLVFARALGAARNGNIDAARKDLARLQELRGTLMTARDVGSWRDYWIGAVEIHHQMVTAWIASTQGNREEALQILRRAADREDATERDPVIPGSMIPARELFGEMLLEANAPQQALQAFEASMRVEPSRFWGLYGAARAAELAGDRVRAETYYTRLVTQAGCADSARPALMAAKAFLAQQRSHHD